MITLNRFPVLGLWSKCCAEKMGYQEKEAKAIAHAFSVLGAIRSNGAGRGGPKKIDSGVSHDGISQKEFIRFSGDNLECQRINGELMCKVGGGKQTDSTYTTSVERKFSPEYYNKLQESFRKYLTNINPEGKLPYKLYDKFKKSCAEGRSINIEKLIEWCNQGE